MVLLFVATYLTRVDFAIFGLNIKSDTPIMMIYLNDCVCCRHIIICGGITFETLTTVVKNFIHEDAAMEKTDIVIIDM